VSVAYQIDASGPIEVLEILGAGLGDLTRPIGDVLTMGLQDAQDEIRSEGTMFGDRWPEMSPLTPRVAMVLYGITRDPFSLLERSGALFESLTPHGPGNIFEPGPQEGEAGSALAWAALQQDGTSSTFHVLQGHGSSPGGIPERPFLGWHETRGDEYVEIFAHSLFEGVE
jgi:hypothetical protein